MNATKARNILHTVVTCQCFKAHSRCIFPTALRQLSMIRLRNQNVSGLCRYGYKTTRGENNTHRQSFSRTISSRHVNSEMTEHYLDTQDSEILQILQNDMIVVKDFITEEEEKSLLDEVDKYMKRLRYEFDHWDNAIHGYRETEKRSWSEENSTILQRVKDRAFTADVSPLAYVHVLDIAKDGYIKPHVDAVRFCGDTITGMCLLSSCVMRLALESASERYADIHLPRRALYIMRNKARYDFTHEVLKDEESYFRGQHIPRERRISVICRNEPSRSLDE